MNKSGAADLWSLATHRRRARSDVWCSLLPNIPNAGGRHSCSPVYPLPLWPRPCSPPLEEELFIGAIFARKQLASASMAADLRANRTLSKRAIERDVAAELQLSDDGDDDDDSDGDATYGSKATGAKRQRQRRGKAVLQVLKHQSLQPLLSPATVSKPELDRDFAPLSDLKGATPQAVLGRRITVWYSDDGGTVTPAHGLVTYLCDEQARLFVVFDGDEELDGLWVDGRDEWAWADESEVGPAPPARPVPGCWRLEAKEDESSGRSDACAAGGPTDPDSEPEELDGQLGAVEKIFLVRCCGRQAQHGAPRAGAAAAPTAALELFVKWRGLAHVHSQWRTSILNGCHRPSSRPRVHSISGPLDAS